MFSIEFEQISRRSEKIDIDALEVWSQCSTRLKELGYKLRQVKRFEEVQALVADLQKPYLTPKMDPALHDFTSETCVWFVLEKDGTPAAAMAARLETLGRETVGTYWPRIMKRGYGQGRREVIANVAQPLANELSGRLVYYGDLVIHPDFRRLGNKLEFFVRSSVIFAEIKWAPDWHYAFLTERHFRAGASTVYGFTRTLPNACDWIDPPEGRGSEEACIWMPAAEFAHVLRAQSRALQEL